MNLNKELTLFSNDVPVNTLLAAVDNIVIRLRKCVDKAGVHYEGVSWQELPVYKMLLEEIPEYVSQPTIQELPFSREKNVLEFKVKAPFDFDVLEYCNNLRVSKQPPYICPIFECNKPYKSMCGLQYHLVNFEHSSSSKGSQNSSSPVSPKLIPRARKSNKRRKKKRTNHCIRPSPSVIPEVISSVSEELPYADAQKLVEFNLNGAMIRCDITQPLPIMSLEEYELAVANLSDTNSVTGPGASEDNAVKSTEIKLCSFLAEDLRTSSHWAELSPVMTGSQSKSLESFVKLPEPCFKVNPEYNLTHSSARLSAYIKFIEKSLEEMDGEVEYDMDEEDAAWLSIINEKRQGCNLTQVPIDTFELLMDRLEKESYFQMQTNMAGGSCAPSDDDAVCSICMNGECYNSNVILFCDMCNLAVHQDCYGVPYIPEGQWLCRRCLQSPSRAVDCVLCPNSGGAFKQTDRGHWAHVVCALWIPEVRFANTVFLEPIDSIETIRPARWKLTCYICKQRGVGACIQCYKTNCFSAFHVTCAQHAGLFMKIDTVRDTHTLGAEPHSVPVQKTAFCDSHTPADAEAGLRLPTLPTGDQLVTAAPSPLNQMQKMNHARRILAQKRTLVPVISIPTIPPHRIQEIGSLVSVAKKSQFIQRLIAYWTLKRHLRNGVPLLRRLQCSQLSRSAEPSHSKQVVDDIGELYQQLKYWQSLSQDLKRGQFLCELICKREKLKKELVKVKSTSLLIELCPLRNFLNQLLDLLQARDTGDIFIEPVDQTEVLDYSDVVKHPMDLSTMRSKVDAFQYCDLAQFEADFYLMIDNCLAYNGKDTVFYKAGIKMRKQGGSLLQQMRRDLELMGITSVKPFPMLVEKSQPPVTLAEDLVTCEIDRELAVVADPSNTMSKDEIMCKLLQLLDRIQNLKRGLARAKRVKFVKHELVKLRRRITTEKGLACQQHVRRSKGNSDSDKGNLDNGEKKENSSIVQLKNPKNKLSEDSGSIVKLKRRKKAWSDFVETSSLMSRSSQKLSTSVRELTPPLTPDEAKCKLENPTPVKTPQCAGEFPASVSPSGVNRRTTVLFTRKAAAAQFREPGPPFSPLPTGAESLPANRRSGRYAKGSQETLAEPPDIIKCKDDINIECPEKFPESFRIYRSGGETHGETDDDSQSDDESSCSQCSSTVGSSSYDSGTDWRESEDIAGSSAISQNVLDQLQLVWAKCRGYPWYPALIINPKMPHGYLHNEVPIPSPPANVLALAFNYTEPVYLVLFFDTKRTWQWLPRNKLEPLGITPELDQIKLTESRKPADRKAVQKAYQEALTHRTQVDGSQDRTG